MLGRLGIWRHVLVLLSVAACAALAVIGVIGNGNRGERFDAKQITVTPAGSDGVRIREIVDEDFGTKDRHGYQRIVPNDFGVPTEITASSPNANADLDVSDYLGDTRIRLGDPNNTLSGQHRYVLTYTLPDAHISATRQLALDIIGSDETLETTRFEVVVTGFTLENPTCNVGAFGTVGGCTLTREGNDYRVVFTPLAAGHGVTIGGTVTATSPVELPPAPPLPTYRKDRRAVLALTMIPLGLAAAAGVFIFATLRGRNEVFSGGAAEAAYGRLPAPNATARGAAALPTTMVSDAQLGQLATTEFVPPKGLDPWQGEVLLDESIGDSTVSAWFSELAAKEAITLTDRKGGLVIGNGPRRSELDPADAAIVDRFFTGRNEITLGTYDKHFAEAWGAVKARQSAAIDASGWWKRHAPSHGSAASGPLAVMLAAVVLVFFAVGSTVFAVLGAFRSWPLALVFAAVVPAFVALCVYARLLPVRSATGSALALQTESFRRFLQASEGRHVEWAWKQGLLREYSAWAVALGAADAWGKALANSGVPPNEYVYANPLLVHSMARSFSATHVAPSSSGSGGGGFSGGSVGGGGGGGSSGSW